MVSIGEFKPSSLDEHTEEFFPQKVQKERPRKTKFFEDDEV